MLFKPKTKAVDPKWRLIGLCGKLLIDFLFVASRITIRDEEPIAALRDTKQCIFAFWHSRILLPCYLAKGYGASIMVSNSADGEIIAQILQRQGHAPVRGSTRKGGMRAIIQQINDMRHFGRPAAVVPDGPQGPRYKVQPGVVVLAQKVGYPIIPITYSAKRRKVFNSWDRFILPWPATPCILIYGRPIWVPKKARAEQINDCMQELERELNRITVAADRHFNHRLDQK